MLVDINTLIYINNTLYLIRNKDSLYLRVSRINDQDKSLRFRINNLIYIGMNEDSIPIYQEGWFRSLEEE